VTLDFSWDDAVTMNIGFVPSLAYSTAYTITVGTGAEDLEGESMASPFELSFTTEQAPPPDPPFVSSFSPADGATNQPTTLTAQLIFSEAMSQASVAVATTIDDPSVTLDFSWDDAVTMNIGFVPSLAYSTAYTITVGTGAEDLEGESMASAFELSFTTGGQPIFAFDLPNTGQTTCYNNTTVIPCPSPGEPFYGQDAQYATVGDNFIDYLDGTIGAVQTGLLWQEGYSGSFTTVYNWYQASGMYDPIHNPNNEDVCGSLNLAGQVWRLPNVRELETIQNYGESYPAIDETYFNVPVGMPRFWAQDTSASSSSDAYYVDLSDGKVSTTAKDLSVFFYDFYLRCVEGVPLPVGQFTANGNSTVTEETTGLIFQDSYGANEDTTISWEAALAYCETLSLAASTDWRLPSVRELFNMVDLSAHDPAISNAFTTGRSSPYWTSTTFDLDFTAAWYVNLLNGTLNSQTKTTSIYNYVRCVRGPEP
jgi:hypothetical protein